MECGGGCSRLLPAALGYALCPTCWNVDQICRQERVESLAALAEKRYARERLLFRVVDLLRRSMVSDSERLILELESVFASLS